MQERHSSQPYALFDNYAKASHGSVGLALDSECDRPHIIFMVKSRLFGTGILSLILFTQICYAGDRQALLDCRYGADTHVEPQKDTSNAKSKKSQPTVELSQQHSISLAWNASVPASDSPGDAIAGYNVFRHEPGQKCSSKKCEQINLAPIRNTACSDHTVSAGHTYIYQIQAVTARGVVSRLSNEARATVP